MANTQPRANGKFTKKASPGNGNTQVLEPNSVMALTQQRQAEIKQKIHKLNTDFTAYYSPKDNIFGAGGSATDDYDRPTLEELRQICYNRIGVAFRSTAIPARDAMRNHFDFIDYNEKVVKKPQIFKWMIDSDFYNQNVEWVKYSLQYGTGFLHKIWTTKETLEDPPPKGPPKKFQAFPPVFMHPINLHEHYGEGQLDYDEEVWEFQGGVLGSRKIHRDRVEVLSIEPIAGQWRGLSVLEPVWTPLMCYYNLMIYALRGIAKWGMIVPALKMGNGEIGKPAYDKYLDLMIEYQANYFYLLGKDDELEFNQSKIGQGLGEILEVFKEDIASGVHVPLNQLFGRAQSGGIGGEGALTMEREYLSNLANIQHAASDNDLRVIRHSGFDVEGLRLDWALALQKTSEQRMKEEAMETQNLILTEQLKQMRLQTKMAREQMKMLAEPGIQEGEEEALALTQENTTLADFSAIVDRNNQICATLQERFPILRRGY